VLGKENSRDCQVVNIAGRKSWEVGTQLLATPRITKVPRKKIKENLWPPTVVAMRQCHLHPNILREDSEPAGLDGENFRGH
jgi:hypothetical protein